MVLGAAPGTQVPDDFLLHYGAAAAATSDPVVLAVKLEVIQYFGRRAGSVAAIMCVPTPDLVRQKALPRVHKPADFVLLVNSAIYGTLATPPFRTPAEAPLTEDVYARKHARDGASKATGTARHDWWEVRVEHRGPPV